MFGVDHRIGNGAFGGITPRRRVVSRAERQQTADHGPDGVLSLARSEIEHQSLVHLETCRRGRAGKFVRQTRLADAGFAADVDRETRVAVAAAGERAFDLGEFGAAADEWSHWLLWPRRQDR